MPVEHLAIVEGPMAGFGDNGEAGDFVERGRKWMLEHGVRPSWAIGAAVVGGLASESMGKGVMLGAAAGSALSYLCTKTCQSEQPQMVGVVPMGQIEKAHVQQLGIGQIEKAHVQQLGAIEWTPTNVIGLGAAGLLAAYLLLGRG
jgi:hypothetical protein